MTSNKAGIIFHNKIDRLSLSHSPGVWASWRAKRPLIDAARNVGLTEEKKRGKKKKKTIGRVGYIIDQNTVLCKILSVDHCTFYVWMAFSRSSAMAVSQGGTDLVLQNNVGMFSQYPITDRPILLLPGAYLF